VSDLKIRDGIGKGFSALVDKFNLLGTHSFTEAFKEFRVSSTGQAFNINTGTVTLTEPTASAVFYLSNTGSTIWRIPLILYLIGTSTGGTGDGVVDIYKNVTGGSIVDNAIAVDMQESRNIGSSAVLTGSIFKGAEGNTRTGGTQIVSTIVRQTQRIAIEVGDIVVPPGNNLMVVHTPQPSNSNVKCQYVAEIWEQDI